MGFLYIAGGKKSEDRKEAPATDAYSIDASTIDEEQYVGSAGAEGVDSDQLNESIENQPAGGLIAQPLPEESVELSTLELREIEQAIREAFSGGKPVRWLRGYAVPSEPNPTSGCRQVYFSDDEKPGWQSKPQTVCPE